MVAIMVVEALVIIVDNYGNDSDGNYGNDGY